MKVLLLNDCSSYHCGSAAVTAAILRLGAARGMQITIHDDRSDLPADSAWDLVLVNGEGTFHHRAPRALRLHELAREAKSRGARVALINTVLQSMPLDFTIYDRVTTRERLSAAHAPGHDMRVIPDLAFCHEEPPPTVPPPERSGILFMDGISARHKSMIETVARAHGEEVLRLCDWAQPLDDLLALLRSKRLLVTGRFHGVVFALLTGTPVLALPSNTWKTRGIMMDFGVPDQFCRTQRELEAALAREWPGPAPVDILDIRGKWGRLFDELANPAPWAKPPPDELVPPMVTVLRTAAEHPPVAPGKTCVLVGNGPSVLQGRQGAEIDAHDEVLRFNNFRIHGYEEHTGTKTTLWSTFGHGMLPKDDTQRPARAIFIHGDSGNPAYPVAELWRIPREFYRACQQRVQDASQRPEQRRALVRPSSGLLVALWLLEIAGVPSLTLAGFDHFRRTQRRQHHYWNARVFGRTHEHDGDAEILVFAELERAGRVKYLAQEVQGSGFGVQRSAPDPGARPTHAELVAMPREDRIAEFRARNEALAAAKKSKHRKPSQTTNRRRSSTALPS